MMQICLIPEADFRVLLLLNVVAFFSLPLQMGSQMDSRNRNFWCTLSEVWKWTFGSRWSDSGIWVAPLCATSPRHQYAGNGVGYSPKNPFSAGSIQGGRIQHMVYQNPNTCWLGHTLVVPFNCVWKLQFGKRNWASLQVGLCDAFV